MAMALSAEHRLRIMQITDGQDAPSLAGNSEAEQLENYGLSKGGKLTGAAYALGEVLRELQAARADLEQLRKELGRTEVKGPTRGVDPVNKNPL
jgi:hypothetical protein